MSDTLDVEVELLSSGLLPSETLEQEQEQEQDRDAPHTSCAARSISIRNADSGRSLVASVRKGYPALSAVRVTLTGGDLDRDAAHHAVAKINGILEDHWDAADE